jgi:hypothetical protein
MIRLLRYVVARLDGRARVLRDGVSCLAFIVASACGGGGGDGGDGGTGPGGNNGGTPGYTLTASSTAVTVARGASVNITVTVTRTGGFAGPVSLQPTGQPAGVTAIPAPVSVPSGQTTSTVTFTAGTTAAAGTSTITIVGNGAGVPVQNLAIQLTVTAPTQSGPFTLSLSVASYLALPPTNIQTMPVLTITRNAGFTGPVTVTIPTVPAGLVVAATPTNVTGNTANLGILNGGAPNGTYPITIRAVAAGLGEQTLTFNVIVAPPSTGAITWQFCENAIRFPQDLFVVKDGAGAWTRIVPNGINYSFSLGSPTAQVALVVREGGGYRTTVYQFTAQEIAARATTDCVNYPGASSRTATGQVTGAATSDLVATSMGGFTVTTLGQASYTIPQLPAGVLDLFAVRGFLNTQADPISTRMIVRRGVNPSPGGENALINFNGTEAFDPITATWTFANTNNEGYSITQRFLTAGGTAGGLGVIPGLDRLTTTRTLYGVPTAQTIAGDLHQVIATVQTSGTGQRATRQVIAYTRTLADRTLSFGPAMPAGSVTAIAGTVPARLRAQGTVPNEYNTGVSFEVSQAGIARYATINATRGFLGAGVTYDVQMPDLTGVVGWDTQFALRAGVASTYWIAGGGSPLDFFDGRNIFGATQARWTGIMSGITAPADGATYLLARVAGTITP